MAAIDDPDMQLVAVQLDSRTRMLIAQAMKKAGVTSRPTWLRAAIEAAIDRAGVEDDR
jgi:hypothetical protein